MKIRGALIIGSSFCTTLQTLRGCHRGEILSFGAPALRFAQDFPKLRLDKKI